jgi:RNase P/RNase MRP subunit p29
VADGVRFTGDSARRIAKVVRIVEQGNRDADGIRFGSAVDSARKTFRICTFTGAWSISATKTVTFKYQTTTPNTATALNLFAAVPAPSGSGDCAIAKDGTAWFLIAAKCP